MNIIIASLGISAVGITLLLVKMFQDGHFYLAAALVCALGICALFFGAGIFYKEENQK